MTFDLSPELDAARERARDYAAIALQPPTAAAIDQSASVPEALAREAAAVIVSSDPLALVVTVEELAAASGAVALVAALPGPKGPSLRLAGLRGVVAVDISPRAELVLAAIALGLGRAALESALGMLKEATATPGSHNDAPHWVVADVATELDGARLLVYKAAQVGEREGGGDADIALARLMASGAAGRAVDAALRVAGASGYQLGSVLERLARDVRTVAVVLGTEERQRAQAAEGLLPQ